MVPVKVMATVMVTFGTRRKSQGMIHFLYRGQFISFVIHLTILYPTFIWNERIKQEVTKVIITGGWICIHTMWMDLKNGAWTRIWNLKRAKKCFYQRMLLKPLGEKVHFYKDAKVSDYMWLWVLRETWKYLSRLLFVSKWFEEL